MANTESISSDIKAWAKSLTPNQSKENSNSSGQKKPESVNKDIQAWAIGKT